MPDLPMVTPWDLEKEAATGRRVMRLRQARLRVWRRLFESALTGAVVQASSTAQAASFAALAADAAYVEMQRRFPFDVPPAQGEASTGG